MSPKPASPVDAPAVGRSLAALRTRAADAARTLDLDIADELYEAVAVLGTACGDGELAAEGVAGRGYVAHMRGDLVAAKAFYAEGAGSLRGASARALAWSRLGFAHYDAGDLEAARATLEPLARGECPAEMRPRVIGYLGNVARATGEHARALGLYDEAIRRLVDAGDFRFAATFAMDRAVTELLAGATLQAVQELDALAQDERVAPDPVLGVLVPHYRALARALLDLPVDDPEPGRLPYGGYLARARRALLDDIPSQLDGLGAGVPDNAHARLTLELVLRARASTRRMRGLVVSRSGAFFRLGDAPTVMLAQRGPLGRILVTLVRERLVRPGASVEPHELVGAGWPAERLLPDARSNRLHVALATLRRLGLRPVLQRTETGYRIARDVDVLLLD